MNRPFAGVNVLEFSTAVAGPYAGQLLADRGAEVVKVEPPGGATERTTVPHIHHMLNRGKRSLCVDLKSDDGRELVRDLIAEYVDVVLVNYRPGVLGRFDLGYETLRATDESLVYCSLTGFGDEGPYSDRPALDPIAQALSGIMTMTGEPDRKPSRIGGSIIDIGAATNAVLGITMALWQRDRTGKGQKVEASLLETAYGWGGEWGTYYTLHDEVPKRMGSKKASYAPVGAYETTDGLVYVAAFGDPALERLCAALDREDLVDDDRFAGPADRTEHRAALDEILEAEMRSFTREGLVDRLLEFSVPAAKINEIPEVVEDPHLHARNMVVEMESESADGPVLVPGTPLKLSGSDPVNSTDLPDLGEDSAAIASELDYGAAAIERLRETGAIEEG